MAAKSSGKKTGQSSSGNRSVPARKKTARRRRSQNNFLVLRLLILVVAVLVVFEGKLIHTMFSQRSSSIETLQLQPEAADLETQTETVPAEETVPAGTAQAAGDAGTYTGGAGGAIGLAGLSTVDAADSATTSAEEQPQDTGISEYIDSPAVVAKQDVSVDDSYFTDAVFIGDSRMEGFRNTSGITQGEFMTSVGMNLSDISNAKVTTADGTITVYQGLSGRQYGKIYLMLGTNDLGFYPWEEFLPTAEGVLKQMHELQPGAIIYVCGVIYVEESKITTDYVNNANVIKVNGYLLQACEELPYCHYLNLNEVFTNGWQSLIDGASQDGVHLYEKYSVMMLDYLKSHYITVEAPAEEATEVKA